MELLQQAAAGPWLRWAVWLAAGLAAVSLLLMVQVLLLSEVTVRRNRRRRAFERRWRPRLAAASLGDAAALSAPARADRAWFLAAWCQMQQPLRGAAHERLNALLRRFGLDATAVALAEGGDMDRQLLALACMKHLADPGHWDVAAGLARAPNGIRSLAAAEVLVAIDAVAAMGVLAPLFAERSDWSLPRVIQLCRRAGPAALTPPLLALLARPLPPGARDRLLAVLPFADLATTTPWARALLSGTPAPNETVAALDVLALAGDPRDRERIVAALGSDRARVRVAALRALRAIARVGDLVLLAPHLEDRDWAVRQASADAIASLPGLPRERLLAIADGVSDRYGRDALRRAVAERIA